MEINYDKLVREMLNTYCIELNGHCGDCAEYAITLRKKFEAKDAETLRLIYSMIK